MPDATLPWRPVLIVDLDGTILSINSFRHWVLFLLRGRFPGLGLPARLRLSATVAGLLLKRRLHLVGHEEFKHALQRLWQRATSGDQGAAESLFLAELERFVRPDLRPVLAAIAAGEYDAILATAAAGDYAEAFGRRLGFSHISATKRDRAPGELSNDGERKCASVLALLDQRGWRDRRLILFTDHEEDLPLVRICWVVYWFGSRVRPEAGSVEALILSGDTAWRQLMPDHVGR